MKILLSIEYKTRLVNYFPNLSMETIFMKTENSKTSEQNKFVLNLLQRLDLKSSNIYVALQNFFIYNTWKNIRQQCKNIKLKIIAPTWKDKLKLPDGCYSVADIQDYTEYIIKNMKYYPLIPLIIFTST